MPTVAHATKTVVVKDFPEHYAHARACA